MQFSVDDLKLIVGGKSKSRDVWCEDEEDNAVLPCPIKIFGARAVGKRVRRADDEPQIW